MNRVRVMPLVAVLLVPAAALAQDGAPRTTLFSIAGGASQYDIGNTGTGIVIATRSPILAGRFAVIEPGITFFSYVNQFSRRTNLLLPEISLQATLPGGRVRPFVGGGIGFSTYLSGPNRNELTLHIVSGVRLFLPGTWGISAEVRARTIDPWAGRTLDFTLGLLRMPRRF